MTRNILILCVAASLAACAKSQQSAEQQAPSEPAAATSAPAVASAAPAAAKPAAPAAPATRDNAALLAPEKATERAPETFRVKFATTKGDFTVEVTRAWAPLGADRFYNLVKVGFYDNVAFFRVIQGFMAQFGIHGSPEVMSKWRGATIADDPVGAASNKRGHVTFAMAGPNSRTTQLFINFGDNANLDSMGFSPFGRVISGMEIVDSIYNGYGEGQPMGRGPDQGRIQGEGNAYLKAEYPNLDYIKKATLQ